MTADPALPLRLYEAMLRIRRTEERVAERYADQQMRCPTHLCIGQEAIAVGVCAALGADDTVFSNHRAHGHYLAKGGDMGRMIAEFYGKSDGCCGGRGGSMHLIDKSVGFLGSTPIVGGTVPLAVGVGWSHKLQKQPLVSVAFFGDGCFEEGVVHESLNFAALHKLPVVFICENNEFSVYTHLSERQPDRPIHAIAAAHGWTTHHGDGNDVMAVHLATEAAVARARAGEGPQFLQFSVYRWREHCGPNFDDQLGYRDEDTIDTGMGSCPVTRMRHALAGKDLSEQQHEAIVSRIEAEIDAAFGFAMASPAPTYEDSRSHVYAA
ncbi:MAG: thiamine pyrophosphate-dependent dehydrogenase E1 component subunit alpha [Pseudomonadota bacterium]